MISSLWAQGVRRYSSALSGIMALAAVFAFVTIAFAAADTDFTQTINAGTLSVDIVNGSYVTVASPAVTMTATTFSFGCNTSTGIFGATSTEVIYVTNPDAADGGWAMSLAAASSGELWVGAGGNMDYNDPANTASCPTDGNDTDNKRGALHVDPSGAILATGQCASCATSNISLGSSSVFREGVTTSITMLTGAANSDDIGDWRLTNILMRQAIPAEQAASSYTLNLTVSILAS